MQKRTRTPAPVVPRWLPSPLRLVTLALALAFVVFALSRPHTADAAGLATAPPQPPATPPSYANVPQGSIVGAKGVQAPNGGPPSQDDVSRFAQSNNPPGNMLKGKSSIIAVLKLTSGDLSGLLHTPTGLPDATPLWFVELGGQFVFPGSSSQHDGIRFTTAFEVFLADTGNEIMDGGLAQPTGNPTGGPTPTPTTNPNATPTPAGVPTATPTQPPANNPTPTPQPQHTCTKVGGSAARFNSDIRYFDFDAGLQHTVLQASDDLHYTSGQANTFGPVNNATIFDWGSGSPPCSQFLSVAYQGGGTVPVKLNETYMMRTNGAHIAVFTVTNYSTDTIAITWAIYTVS